MASNQSELETEKWYEVQQKQFSEKLDHYDYKETPHFKRVLSKFLEFAEIPENAHILEIGCGTGRYTLNLLRAGYKVTGIDLSEESIEVLVKQTEKENLSSQLEVKVARLEDYLPEGKYDFIMCIHLLHHVEDIYVALKHFYSLLNPNGKFAGLEPNPYNPSWYIKRGQDWEAEKGLVRCTESNFRKYFADAGYENVRVLKYGAVPSSVYNRLPYFSGIENVFSQIPLFNKILALHYISGERIGRLSFLLCALNHIFSEFLSQ